MNQSLSSDKFPDQPHLQVILNEKDNAEVYNLHSVTIESINQTDTLNWPSLEFQFSASQMFGCSTLGEARPNNQRLSLFRTLIDGVRTGAPQYLKLLPDQYTANQQRNSSVTYFATKKSSYPKGAKLADVIDLNSIMTDRWKQLKTNNHPLIQTWEQLYQRNEQQAVILDSDSKAQPNIRSLRPSELDLFAIDLLLGFDNDEIMARSKVQNKLKQPYDQSSFQSVMQLLLLVDGI